MYTNESIMNTARKCAYIAVRLAHRQRAHQQYAEILDALRHPTATLPGTHAAEDCVQEAAVALWESYAVSALAERFGNVAEEDAIAAQREAETAAIHAVHNWLYAAIKTPAKHLYIDQYREDGSVDFVDVTADMRHIVNHVYADSLVSLCFAALTPRQRDICKAYFVEGYSMAVVAHRFHTTENAVKQTIHKSRAKFDRVRAEYDAE